VSFIAFHEGASTQKLDQLESSFMYIQIFKEILLTMSYNRQSIKDLANYCHQFFNGNMRELNIIEEFKHNYPPKSPILWYRRECFTYQMLNRALHALESYASINMGFFIRDLHNQIQKLYHQQFGSYQGNFFIVYRGQGRSITNFKKFLKTKGGLMCFNKFLSITTKREVSLLFIKVALVETDMVGILFKMSIDRAVSSSSFASI
jgi:hypothetical protein